MKTIAIILASFCLTTAAMANSCADQAAAKLTGAAKTSFMTKCTKDAQAACETQAADKKLAGAAKTSRQEVRNRRHRYVSAVIVGRLTVRLISLIGALPP